MRISVQVSIKTKEANPILIMYSPYNFVLSVGSRLFDGFDANVDDDKEGKANYTYVQSVEL